MAFQTEAVIDALQSITFFQGLHKDRLKLIIDEASEKIYEKNQFLFFQEDPAEKIYVCINGRIKLSQITAEGNQVTMHYSGPGEAFGIIAVLREIQYPVTAKAVEESTVLQWDAHNLKNWLREEPQIALNSIQILSKFIETFQSRITELSTEKVERRIARTLLRLTQQTGQQEVDGIRLNISLSRQDIADMTGTTLFTVSRTLSKWENEDIINSRDSQILITNPHQLVNIADDLSN